MRSIYSIFMGLIVVVFIVLTGGCKSANDYTQDRAENAVKHFEAARFRELQSGTPLSLSFCIGTALKNNLQVRINDMEVQVQNEFKTAEALGMLPQLNINDNFTARSNSPAASSEKIAATGETYGASTSEDKAINYLNIDLMFSMLDFGLAFFNTRQGADRVLLHKQRAARAEQNLAFDVVRAYFKVAAAQRAIKMTTSLLEQCRTRSELIFELSKDRQITPIRAFDESRRFINMEKRLTNYVRSYENACVELRTLMGYYPNANIFVDETVLDRVPEFRFPEIGVMEQVAILQRPELYETDIQKHINILECRKTILLMFPNVKIYADWSNSSNSYLYNKSWWELGVRAAYNLLKLPQQVALYKAYSTQVETEEMRSYAQAVAVMAQVRIAYGNLISARERYDLDRKVYTAYDEHLQAALKNRAIGGALPQLEIDHIRLATTQTSIDSLISLGEYYVAYYRLLNVMGLRKIDARSAEELAEELQDAAVRASASIADSRVEFDEQQARAMTKALAYRQSQQRVDNNKRQAEFKAKVNAEIDARIKAESSPEPAAKSK